MITDEQKAEIRGAVLEIISSNTKDEEKIEAIVGAVELALEDKSE